MVDIALVPLLSYTVFMPKPCTHRMHDLGSIVPHIRPKVFTDNQMSQIKYIYYINNVSKDYEDSTKQNNGRLHNSTGTTTGATRSLELLIEEFQSILSFWATGLSSRGKYQGLVHLWLVLSRCRNKMIMQGNNKDKTKIKWVSRNAPIRDSSNISSRITMLKL
jgi:hypothetical protein